MGFKKEDRYAVRRIHEERRRYVYLNPAGEETELPLTFNAQWTNGEPAKLTMHQALLLQQDASAEIGPWLDPKEPETQWRCVHLPTLESWN